MNHTIKIAASIVISLVCLFLVSEFLKPGTIIGMEQRYGSVVFVLHPEGIKCYDTSTDRIEFDYTLLAGTNDYGNGYLTLRADEGMVDDISCTVVDSDFITVQLSSPTKNFMLSDFENYGPLKEDESLTFEYHTSIVGGKTWTNNTEKSISISCDIGKCETTRGVGSCDFYSEVPFFHSTLETCS